MHVAQQLCCCGICNILWWYDTLQWSYIKTNFPMNLNYDGKIVCEMGPWSVLLLRQHLIKGGSSPSEATMIHYEYLLTTLNIPASIRWDLGLVSKYDKTSYCKISQSVELARLGIKMFVSLWNLADTLTAVLPAKFQSNWKTDFVPLRIWKILQ